MRISIMLNNVTHEQAAGSDDQSAFVGWLHMPGAGPDAGNLAQRDEDGKRFGARALPRFSARREAWGGVVVHGPSMMVLQVDADGFEVIQSVIAGESLDDALARSSAPKAEIAAFREFVLLHNL